MSPPMLPLLLLSLALFMHHLHWQLMLPASH
jgi:hypothetical protein